jgi:hypothetical protein
VNTRSPPCSVVAEYGRHRGSEHVPNLGSQEALDKTKETCRQGSILQVYWARRCHRRDVGDGLDR